MDYKYKTVRGQRKVKRMFPGPENRDYQEKFSGGVLFRTLKIRQAV